MIKEEMRKLAARKKDALPIGKLTIPGTFPGANYGAIGIGVPVEYDFFKVAYCIKC